MRQLLFRISAKSLKIEVFSWFCIIGLMLVTHLLQRHFLANYFYWDTHWALSCADQLLQGKKYYTDFFETNPPLILLLHVPFVWFGHFLLIQPIILVQDFFFVLIFCLLGLNLRLLKNIFLTDIVMVYFSLLMIAMSELFFALDAFAGKEHLILLLFLPYILLLTERCKQVKRRTPWLVGFIGLMLGLAIALKPYFIVSVILAEMYYAYRCKSIRAVFRLDTCVMTFFILVYMVGIWIYFPAFYFKVLPLVTHVYIPFFATLPIEKMLMSLPVLIILSACLPSREYRDYVGLLRLATLGFLIVFLVAKQNWYYHLYPALALSFVSVTSIIFLETRSMLRAQFSSREKLKKMCIIYIGCIILILQGSLIISRNIQYAFKPTFSTILEDSIHYCQQTEHHENILILSTFFHTIEIPLLCRQAVSSTRFPNLLFVPGIMQLEKNHQRKRAMYYRTIFFGLLNSDIQKKPPTLIMLDRRETSLLPFLLSDKTFQSFFAYYQLTKQTRYFSFYRVDKSM
jgi:hypothetical protein